METERMDRVPDSLSRGQPPPLDQPDDALCQAYFQLGRIGAWLDEIDFECRWPHGEIPFTEADALKSDLVEALMREQRRLGKRLLRLPFVTCVAA
jgi:hypothetical protein